VDHYNRVRLHSAIGYLAPLDKLEGRAEAIWDRRDQKLWKRENSGKCGGSKWGKCRALTSKPCRLALQRKRD